MTLMRWPLVFPLALMVAFGTAGASEIRDQAKLFSADAIRQAQEHLDRVERQTQVPTIIETVPSLGGEPIADVSLQRAQASGIQGVYVIIAEQDKKLAARDFRNFLGPERRRAIESAFASGFSKLDFDSGLIQGSQAIAQAVNEAGPPSAANRGARGALAGRPQNAGSSGMNILFLIGGVLIVAMLLGRLFARRAASYPGHPGYGGPGKPGMMGGQPGAGLGGQGAGGFGPPGYGRGGGFWRSVLGGMGGAMAGNWLYNQFSGRHHPHDPSQGGYTDGTTASDQGADWGGGEGTDWGGGEGTSWGGGDDWAGGGDWGGGDWGGGDWG